ncbi:MAG: oligosaccharide flippase family protein [Sandaracinaceae bacterium]|nr:oligosaccharide flippase family protein [Sandaracinaceae bacterium]
MDEQPEQTTPGDGAPAAPDGPSDAGADDGLGKKALRSGAWVALGYGGGQILRFGGNLVLTRLLFEEAFGLMALIASVLAGLELFSDIGVGPSIIQSPREDRGFLDTAFTMQAGRGLVLWLVGCALAIPLANLYEEPSLTWMLPLCALSALVNGLSSTKLFTLNRALSLGRIEVIQIGSQAAGMITMVVWALISPTVVALVSGTLVSGAVKLVMTHLYLPGANNRLRWDREAAKELITFGRWIFVSTLLTFLAGQSDRLVFGKLVPMDRLGVYSIGMALATLPSDVVARLAMQVVFPLYSRVHEGEGFGELFQKSRLPILVGAGWACAGLIAGGPAAVEFLYDDRYQAAGWVIQLLAAGAWFTVMGSIYGSVLLAQGTPRYVSMGAAGKLAAMLVLIPAGFYLGGRYDADWAFAGAVAGFALAEVARYLVSMIAARPRVGRLRYDPWLTVVVLGVGVGVAALDRFVAGLGVHALLRGLLVALVVTLLWAPLGRPHVKVLVEKVRGRLGRRAG